MTEKPTPKSTEAHKEIQRLEQQFDKFQEKIDQLTLDRLNDAPKKEVDTQTKLAQSEIADSSDIFLKPHRSIGSREPFNEKYRSDYEFIKEYVFFIAENNEIMGEAIDMWTKPFPGLPAEWWKVPVNKPIWAPRYVAEQIKRCCYHKLSMDNSKRTSSHKLGEDYGDFVVDETVNRIDARPATKQKSIFMGAKIF
jgi:hypothetical protein